MRNIRTRRRLRYILLPLLAVCATIFVEGRIEAFVPEVKNVAESRIENALGGRVRLSIGDIDGGLIHPLVLSDVKVGSQKGANDQPSLVISSIKTNYRLWDILRIAHAANTKNAQALPHFLLGVSSFDVSFATINKETSGFVRVENNHDGSDIRGYISLFSSDKIDFSGKIKGGSYEIEFRPKKGVVKVAGSLSPDGSLEANFKAYHLSFGGYDLVFDGVLNAKADVNRDGYKRPVLRGSIDIKNCILNYKPFLGLKAAYKITDGVLEVTNLSLSDIFKGNGTFQLTEPFNANLNLVVNNLSLGWLEIALGVVDGSSILSGTANAKCGFKGPIANLRSDIQIDVKKGTIGPLEFEGLSAHLKGDGPMIRIDDSRITRESGYFVLAGEIDLTRKGAQGVFERVKLVGDDQAINWDSLATSKTQNVRELNMKKRISDEINVDFKKFSSEDTIDESLKYGDEVQLEYKLHPNDSLKVTVGQDKDFLGLEHKNKF